MYYDRVYLCEGQKWDLEREVRKRDYEVQEIHKRKQQKKKKKKKQTVNNARRKRATASRTFLLCNPSLNVSLRVVSRCSTLFLYIYIRLYLSSFFSLFHDVSLGEHVEWLFNNQKSNNEKERLRSLALFFFSFFFFFFVNASTKTNVKTKKYDFASGILLYFCNFDDVSYGHLILYCIILVSPVSVIYLPFSSIRLSFPG